MQLRLWPRRLIGCGPERRAGITLSSSRRRYWRGAFRSRTAKNEIGPSRGSSSLTASIRHRCIFFRENSRTWRWPGLRQVAHRKQPRHRVQARYRRRSFRRPINNPGRWRRHRRVVEADGGPAIASAACRRVSLPSATCRRRGRLRIAGGSDEVPCAIRRKTSATIVGYMFHHHRSGEVGIAAFQSKSLKMAFGAGGARS